LVNELIRKNRSYRRFDGSHKVSDSILFELVNNARLSSSAANLQPLRYMIVNSAEKAQAVYDTVKWAAYLPDWAGPKVDERPSSYIVILGDKSYPNYHYIDAGIAVQSILLSAVEKGLGGCIFASTDKAKLREELDIDVDLEVILVLAIGKPTDKVILTELPPEGDVKYWRDDSDIHYVPKRKLEDIIVATFSERNE